MESARSANAFNQKLSVLAARLAERDIVVASLHCDWRSFGSWTLEAQRGAAADAYGKALRAQQFDVSGPDVIRADWDGRERLLTIDQAPTPPLSSPGPWTRRLDQAFDNTDDALRFVEEYLEAWCREGDST